MDSRILSITVKPEGLIAKDNPVLLTLRPFSFVSNRRIFSFTNATRTIIIVFLLFCLFAFGFVFLLNWCVNKQGLCDKEIVISLIHLCLSFH